MLPFLFLRCLGILFLTSIIIFSCNQQETDEIIPAISEHQKLINLLSTNTWTVDENSVRFCDETRSEWAFYGFKFELYEHYNDSLSFYYRAINIPPFDGIDKIWPETGTLSFESGFDASIDYNTLIRNDEVAISISYDTLNRDIPMISMDLFLILEDGL